MNLEKIGQFLCELRKEYGYTQKQIGDFLGITDNSVSKWERGINAPDISYLQNLADLYHVTVQELLQGKRAFQKKEKNLKHQEKILEVKNLTKSFGKRKVLDDISLDIYEGDIVGLIGPNGSGKTTFMKTIVGLYYADSGSVKIAGYDIQKNLEQALSKIGCMIENPDMYSHLTGRKNLQITAILNQLKKKDNIEEMIHFVGLEDRIDEKVKTYSLGMKQRLGLANALIKKPKLLILDEPTNGLDPYGIKELRELLKKISIEQNMSILISSHILSEIENVCDRIFIINSGKLVSEFGIEEIKYKHISLEDEFFQEIEKGREEQ